MKISTFPIVFARRIHSVSVIGSGLMGSGIAQVTAQAGLKVTLIDQSEVVLQKAQANIKKSLSQVAKKKFKDAGDEAQKQRFVSEALERINLSTETVKGCKDADLVIEAVVENIKIKHDIFKILDKEVPSPCIFATNTSSLLIKDVSLPVSRKDRFIGLHFFNPVPVMRLLEVVKTNQVSDATIKNVLDYGQKIGKSTVLCSDTPGFIVNRLLIPNLLEAIRLFERGDATSQDIDLAMKLGAGHPMGPFELADYVGLDTIKFIIDGWHTRNPENPLFKPSEMLNKLCTEGKLGRKTGEGFYKYDAMGNKLV